MFPPEIWAIILNQIDNPIELRRLISVNKDWQAMINRILKTTPKWRELCRKTIPNDCELRKIVAQRWPNYMYPLYGNFLTDNSVSAKTWEEVYRTWTEWKKCQIIKPIIKRITVKDLLYDNTVVYMPTEHIHVCSAVWGNKVNNF